MPTLSAGVKGERAQLIGDGQKKTSLSCLHTLSPNPYVSCLFLALLVVLRHGAFLCRPAISRLLFMHCIPVLRSDIHVPPLYMTKHNAPKGTNETCLFEQLNELERGKCCCHKNPTKTYTGFGGEHFDYYYFEHLRAHLPEEFAFYLWCDGLRGHLNAERRKKAHEEFSLAVTIIPPSKPLAFLRSSYEPIYCKA